MMQRVARTNSPFAYVCVHLQAIMLNNATNSSGGATNSAGADSNGIIGGVALLARVTQAEFLAGNALSYVSGFVLSRS